MRRTFIALFTLLCGCSLNVPPSPQASGVVPSCATGDVLQGGQCVPLASLKGNHAATASNAGQADYAQIADVSDDADVALQTHSIDPTVQLDLAAPGAQPGTQPAPLRVLGGPMRIDLGKVFAHVATFASDGINPILVGSAGGQSASDIPLAGGQAIFTLSHDSTVRVRAHGMLQGTGDASQGTFSTCAISVGLFQTGGGGGPIVSGSAVVSAYVSDGSSTDDRPWFLQFEVPLPAGSYTASATLFIDNQTYFGNVCGVNGFADAAVRVQIDGT